MTPSLIERAIDDTARAMTAGEPDAAFCAVVMERLNQGRAWRRSWLAPVAVAALVLIAVVMRPSLQRPRDREVVRARPIDLTASVPAPRSLTFESAGITKPYATTPHVPSDVVALAPPRLEVSSLALEAIDHGESLHIPALESITPIIVTAIGDPQGERQ